MVIRKYWGRIAGIIVVVFTSLSCNPLVNETEVSSSNKNIYLEEGSYEIVDAKTVSSKSTNEIKHLSNPSKIWSKCNVDNVVIYDSSYGELFVYDLSMKLLRILEIGSEEGFYNVVIGHDSYIVLTTEKIYLFSNDDQMITSTSNENQYS